MVKPKNAKVPRDLVKLMDDAVDGLCWRPKSLPCIKPTSEDVDKCGRCYAERLLEMGYKKEHKHEV